MLWCSLWAYEGAPSLTRPAPDPFAKSHILIIYIYFYVIVMQKHMEIALFSTVGLWEFVFKSICRWISAVGGPQHHNWALWAHSRPYRKYLSRRFCTRVGYVVKGCWLMKYFENVDNATSCCMRTCGPNQCAASGWDLVGRDHHGSVAKFFREIRNADCIGHFCSFFRNGSILQ